MELGNLIFGNSRGNFEVNRNLQDEFCEALEAMGFDSYGNKDDNPEWAFENEVFRMQPYYWGDCTCGFVERDETWSETNHHAPHCYQTALKAALAEWDAENDYAAIEGRAFGRDEVLPGFDGEVAQHGPVVVATFAPRNDDAMAAWRKAHDRRRAFEDRLYKDLCAQFGLGALGCAVHCTCTYRADYAAWRATNDHSADCPVVTPNFWHKPSGFRLDWYKYPLRDSYSSDKLTRAMMRAMLADCAASLGVTL